MPQVEKLYDMKNVLYVLVKLIKIYQSSETFRKALQYIDTKGNGKSMCSALSDSNYQELLNIVQDETKVEAKKCEEKRN
jgi:hypothetical protein